MNEPLRSLDINLKKLYKETTKVLKNAPLTTQDFGLGIKYMERNELIEKLKIDVEK